MKSIKSVITTSALLLYQASLNACTSDRIQVIGKNVYLMSRPSSYSSVVLKMPENFANINGCITGGGSNSYKIDRRGNRWWYVGVDLVDGYGPSTRLNAYDRPTRSVDGWILAKKMKVVTRCCQA
jgi:hypothetical protein